MNTDHSKKDIKVLCVDDEPDLLEVLKTSIEGLGYDVLTAKDGAQALELMQSFGDRIALIVSDNVMPGKTGVDLRRETVDRFGQIPFMMISGQTKGEDVLADPDLKISSFLAKPFNLDTLLSAVNEASQPRVAGILEDDELLQGFLVDARTLTDEMERLILDLEVNPNDEAAINRIFSCAHTIKGTSGFFKPDTVNKFMHAFEDCLSHIKKNPSVNTSASVSVLLEAVDIIKTLLNNLESHSAPSTPLDSLVKVFDPAARVAASEAPRHITAPTESQAKVPGKTSEEIRVDVRVLNQFIEKSGDITVLRNTINKVLGSLQAKYSDDRTFSMLSSLMEDIYKTTNGMQEQVVDLKKISASQIVKPLARTLRDLSTSLGKKIRLDVEGGDLRIDLTLGESLGNMLIHLLRNSADHAIESGAERAKLGKPETGKIEITFREAGVFLVVEIADDGRGLDPKRILESALKKGLVTKDDATRLTTQQIQMLIFEPGFSTAETITDISGRGVGTAMVKEVIAEMGGTLEVQSEVGLGTRMIMRLPIPKSTVIISSLLFQIGQETYAVAQDQIDSVLDCAISSTQSSIRAVGQAICIEHEGHLHPLVRVRGDTSQVGGIPSRGYFIKVKSQLGSYFIFADDIQGTEDIVVKPHAPWATNSTYYAGATFLSDGRIGLVLNVHEIARQNGVANEKPRLATRTEIRTSESLQRLITFYLSDAETAYALEQNDIVRVDRVPRAKIQKTAQDEVIIFRGTAVRIIDLQKMMMIAAAPSPNTTATDFVNLIIVQNGPANFVAYVIGEIGDLIETSTNAEPAFYSGHHKVQVINGRSLTILQKDEILRQWSELKITRPSITRSAA